MRALVQALVLIATLLVAPGAGWAREEILNYDIVVEVQSDASVVVTESIRVRAEGLDIRRGIYRDIPVYTYGALGDRRSGGLDVRAVERDGRPEPYFLDHGNSDVRIYVGDKTVWIEPGIYTYTLKYRMGGQVGFFEDYDEIYWNATGTRWKFPIRQAVVRVVVPEGARIKQVDAYTGRRGAAGKDFEVRRPDDNVAVFRTTRALNRYEGITVAVAWQKGLVAPPTEFQGAWTWMTNNLGLMTLFGGAFAALYFYFTTWLRIGRDPEKGIVIPLFAPPDGLSPAAVSYVHHMKLASAGRGASKALIAALLSLAVKSKIRIREDSDGDVSVEVIDRSRDGLPSGETAIMRNLFTTSDVYDFARHTPSRFLAARGAFQSALLGEHRNVFFRNNRGYFIAGIAITIVTGLGFLILQQPPDDQVGVLIAATVATAVTVLLMAGGVSNMQPASGGVASKALGGLMFAGGLCGLGVLGWYLASIQSFIALPGIVMGVLVAALLVFYRLVRAPTPVGRKVMDQIEGFKLYLSVAEAERMNMAGAPDMSTDLFERYLPYAVALGVEKPWSQALASHLERMHLDAQDGYRPNWYSGRSWDGRSLGRATEGMVSAMSDSMAAATPSSSGSGSGSFGGGSSGGGGGGGGGGGW